MLHHMKQFCHLISRQGFSIVNMGHAHHSGGAKNSKYFSRLVNDYEEAYRGVLGAVVQ